MRSMIKQGYVYENLMIALKPLNKKLAGRMIRIVSAITNRNEMKSETALRAMAGYSRGGKLKEIESFL